MASQDLPLPPVRNTAPWPGQLIPRWAGLVVVLLAEVLFLTFRFDGVAEAAGGTWWPVLALRLGVAVTAAVILFHGKRLWREVRELPSGLSERHRFWPFLVAHLASFLGFACLTAVLFEGGVLSAEGAGFWWAAWSLTGAVTLALWLGAVLSPAAWLLLARRCPGAVAVGLSAGLAAWALGYLVTARLWEPLGWPVLWLVYQLVSLVSRDAVCLPDSFTVGTTAFSVQIAPHCSGYEGIGLVWAFLGLYLWFARAQLKFPHALLLLPLGTAVIWGANVLRITVLILIGTWGAPSVALGGFHSQAGWLAFNAVALGLVFLSRHVRLFATTPSGGTRSASRATAAYLAPLLTLVATAMITGALSSGVDWLYPLRVVTVAVVVWLFWRKSGGWRLDWSWGAAALGTAAFGVWLALEPFAPGRAAGVELAAGLTGLGLPGAAAWLYFRVVGSVALVPLAEELAFRGYLVRRLQASDFEQVPAGRFSWFSFMATSALFGALHGRWVAGTLAGLLYALALYRRGKLSDAVVAHATTNALIAAYVLLTGSWSLWV